MRIQLEIITEQFDYPQVLILSVEIKNDDYYHHPRLSVYHYWWILVEFVFELVQQMMADKLIVFVKQRVPNVGLIAKLCNQFGSLDKNGNNCVLAIIAIFCKKQRAR